MGTRPRRLRVPSIGVARRRTFSFMRGRSSLIMMAFPQPESGETSVMRILTTPDLAGFAESLSQGLEAPSPSIGRRPDGLPPPGLRSPSRRDNREVDLAGFQGGTVVRRDRVDRVCHVRPIE